MPIIKDVGLQWVKCDPNRPTRFQGKADQPYKWSTGVVLGVTPSDKKKRIQLQKEFGFSWTEIVDEETGDTLGYRTTIGKYAYKRGPDGKEDFNRKNKVPNVILGDGTAIDPNTVGNGSRGNIQFTTWQNDHGTTSKDLRGIQVTRWKKYEPQEEVEDFELTEEYEVIEPEGADSGADDEIPF